MPRKRACRARSHLALLSQRASHEYHTTTTNNNNNTNTTNNNNNHNKQTNKNNIHHNTSIRHSNINSYNDDKQSYASAPVGLPRARRRDDVAELALPEREGCLVEGCLSATDGIYVYVTMGYLTAEDSARPDDSSRVQSPCIYVCV